MEPLKDCAGLQNEQPTPSPGPMTIDMGSLFSSARRVKGVRPRGGMSGSSAQLAGKDSRDISESQTGSTPSGANIDKQPVASQPVGFWRSPGVLVDCKSFVPVCPIMLPGDHLQLTLTSHCQLRPCDKAINRWREISW